MANDVMASINLLEPNQIEKYEFLIKISFNEFLTFLIKSYYDHLCKRNLLWAVKHLYGQYGTKLSVCMCVCGSQ